MLSKSWRRLISGPQPEVAFARGSDSMDETAVLVFYKSDRSGNETSGRSTNQRFRG